MAGTQPLSEMDPSAHLDNRASIQRQGWDWLPRKRGWQPQAWLLEWNCGASVEGGQLGTLGEPPFLSLLPEPQAQQLAFGELGRRANAAASGSRHRG